MQNRREYVKMIVALSYNKANPFVQLATFLDEHFEDMVKGAGKGSHMWVQDGDPSQNSMASREAMTRVNSVPLPIPPHSPDMNPM